MPLQPLARRNSGLALATPASKSFSVPGLTSILGISVTILSLSIFERLVSSRASKKEKRRSRATPLRSAEDQDRSCDHHGAADEHENRPAARVAPAGTALGNQRGLIFFRGREHAGEATTRR